jgi:hypothetical protein
MSNARERKTSERFSLNAIPVDSTSSERNGKGSLELANIAENRGTTTRKMNSTAASPAETRIAG